jgi:hypothetical protein
MTPVYGKVVRLSAQTIYAILIFASKARANPSGGTKRTSFKAPSNGKYYRLQLCSQGDQTG